MDTVLITGGEIPEYKYIKHLMNADFVCVADSGFDWVVENRIEFDLVVGDMDSVKNIEALDRISADKIITLSRDKDDTDTIYGLKCLKRLNPDRITLIGGGGGRIDHLLGVFSLFETDLSPDIWITARELIFYNRGIFSLEEYRGYNFSLFPLNKVVCSINSYGLKWDLDTVDWTYRSIGISNCVEMDNAWIDSGDNGVLIIIPITGKGFE